MSSCSSRCSGGACGSGASAAARPMAASKVRPLDTAAAFSSFMAEAADKIVMVDFHAVWCGPCKQVAPAVEAMAGEMTDVAFCKVDVDQNKAIAAQYKVESMPTFLFLRHGTVLSSFSGADANKLRSTLSGLRLNAFDVIPTGTDVQVRGLKSQPQHNGTSGVITAYNPVKARYVVKLQGGEAKELSITRTNLLQLLDATIAKTGAAATIAGLGTDGNFLVSTKETRAGGDQAHFAPAALVIGKGARVEVAGLVGAAQFNGKVGQILDYDADAGRYLVQVAMNKQLKLKKANVVL